MTIYPTTTTVRDDAYTLDQLGWKLERTAEQHEGARDYYDNVLVGGAYDQGDAARENAKRHNLAAQECALAAAYVFGLVEKLNQQRQRCTCRLGYEPCKVHGTCGASHVPHRACDHCDY